MTDSLSNSKLFDVSGFVAVVTGGGSGIGLMATQALVENGAKVYIVGRRKEVLDAVVEKYSKSKADHGQIIAIAADITSSDDVHSLAKQIDQQEPNGINILINNAGQALEQSSNRAAQNVDYTCPKSVGEWLVMEGPETWQQTFAVNVTAHFFVTAALLKALNKGRENTPGHSSSVINISSIAGSTKTHSGGQFAYSSSKAAISQLTRMLAYTLVPLRIRVNGIAPGLFPSEMTTGSSDENQKSEIKGKGGSFPAGRTGQESDIASGVLHLASRGGVFINGQVMNIDGGALLQSASVA